MKRKRFAFLLSAACVSVAVLAVTMANSKLSSLFSSAQDKLPYTISFNSGKNKFHSYTGNVGYSGDTTIVTELGNPIGFVYHDVKGVATTWHVLGSEGYFYNTDPIHGMEEITLTFKTNNAAYSVYWSYDDSFDHSQSFVSSSSASTTFDFNGFQPNYFKVVNDSGSNLNISSLDISLSCLNYYPTLDISSENTEMGSVSGPTGVIASGTQVTLVATPNQGYRFVGWYYGETLVSTEASYTFVIGNDDLSYVARFAPESYNLIVESQSLTRGTVSDVSGAYDYRSIVTVEAFPKEGYSFTGWYAGDALVSTENPYSFQMPYQAVHYTAKFTANYYNVTVNNENPELGHVTGMGTYFYGSRVFLTAWPNTGVSVRGWYDANDKLASYNSWYEFIMPNKDVEYTVKFQWTWYRVSLSTNDSSMGSVTGTGSYTYGQNVTLVATPNEHCSFFGWYDGETLISQEATYEFAMPASSVKYEARFVPNHNLYVYSEDELKGTVSSPEERGEGMEVTVTAVAAEGYALDYWYDDDLNEVSNDPSYTFVMPNHDVTLYASFAANFALMVTSSDTSKGTVSGGGRYLPGRSVTVSLDHISGTFMGWYDGEGQLVSTDNPYTFEMPSKNYSLLARFATQQEQERGVVPFVSDDGQSLIYGQYPQTKVSDDGLISILDGLTVADEQGYFTYEGEKYVKSLYQGWNSYCCFSDGTTPVWNVPYWFKVEPIKWRILSTDGDNLFLVSEYILDYQSQGLFSKCSYKDSALRSWLNSEFIDKAFHYYDSLIETTMVDNSASSTGEPENPWACEDTYDKVFLLSYADVTNADYGFVEDEDRRCKPTDYAVAQGVTNNNTLGTGWWATRSPVPYDSTAAKVKYIETGGSVTTKYQGEGVRPAITVRLSN